MIKSNDLRVSMPKVCSKFDTLVYVAAMAYEQEYGLREEEDKDRIFKNTIPRKRRSRPRSDRSSSYSPKAWLRLIEEDISKLQNPNSESDPNSSPSSSSCVTQSKKPRLVDDNISEEDDEKERRVFKKRKIVRRLEPTETTTTTLLPLPTPEWLLNVMRREGNGCTDPKLISTRKLYKTDLSRIQARLSVPFKQVVNPGFLTDEEKGILDGQAKKSRREGVSVDFVDPLMNKYVIDLRKWQMSGNWYYVFVDNWNDVVAANGFKVDQVFHLWSFRSASGKLCFALVPPSPPASDSKDSGDVASTSGECSHGCSSIDDSKNA